MNNQKELKKIEKCISCKDLCAIEREYIDTLSVYGFPVKMSGELVAVKFVYDFMADGYKIIRKKDITEVFCGEAEYFLESIIKNEHKDLSIGFPDINISDMRTLLSDLKKSGQLVTLECEDFEENIIIIGRITDIDGKTVTLRTFDGRGVWDKESACVDIDDITCVSIENAYVNIIAKYLKKE